MAWPKPPKLKVSAKYLKSYNALREEVRQGVQTTHAHLPSKITLPWTVVKPLHLKPNTQIGGPRPRR